MKHPSFYSRIEYPMSRAFQNTVISRSKIVTNENSSIEILQSFVEDPQLLVRKASQA